VGLTCLAAPCRCTMPKLSLNQDGLADPNPALPDQFTVFTAMLTGGISGLGAA